MSNYTFILDNPSYSVSLHDDIHTIDTLWDDVAGANIFLNASFYKALQESPPSGVRFVYSIIYKDEVPCGGLHFQVKEIKLNESLRLERKSDKLINKLLYNLKVFAAKQIQANTLICGNLTLTGPYGGSVPNISDAERMNIINQTSEHVRKYLKSKGTRILAILQKDYFKSSHDSIELENYTRFQVQPNMILNLNWTSFDGYLGEMKSKYKVRVRRAKKKMNHLTCRALTLDEIKQHEARISELYRNVMNGAGFNLFVLPNDYFYSLKKHLGEAMTVKGYFSEDILVGYYTSIQKGDELDAHFLGYDFEENKRSQLYLNMLYDLVDEAIQLEKKSLAMSRTALEIKSSVGATAYPMYLYAKMTNGVLNYILPRALKYFTPEEAWKPREIFKSA